MIKCKYRYCDNDISNKKKGAKWCSRKCMFKEINLSIKEKPLEFIDCNKCGKNTNEYFPRFKTCKHCHNNSHPREIKCHNDQCNKVFIGPKNAMYCSDSCYNRMHSIKCKELRKREHTTRKCKRDNCNKDITHRNGNAKYCSPKCRQRHHYLSTINKNNE